MKFSNLPIGARFVRTLTGDYLEKCDVDQLDYSEEYGERIYCAIDCDTGKGCYVADDEDVELEPA